MVVTFSSNEEVKANVQEDNLLFKVELVCGQEPRKKGECDSAVKKVLHSST